MTAPPLPPVLTLEAAEQLAERTLAAMDSPAYRLTFYPDVIDVDAVRVASDLAGLRWHQPISDRLDAAEVWRLCSACGDVPPCPDARRYTAGLLRTAALYDVTP